MAVKTAPLAQRDDRVRPLELVLLDEVRPVGDQARAPSPVRVVTHRAALRVHAGRGLVRLVRDDPVRQARGRPCSRHFVRQPLEVGVPSLHRQERQVEHHRGESLREEARDQGRRGQPVLRIDHHDATKAAESLVVPFRIDDEHAVPLGDQPLGEQARHVALA